MEIVMEAVGVSACFPFCHWEVMEEIVAAGIWCGAWYFVLCLYPFECFDGESAHCFFVVCCASHDDIHACETAHWSDIYYVCLDTAVAIPCGEEVLKGVHGSWCYGRFLVWLGHAYVEGCEVGFLAGNVDAWLEACVVDCETLYYFHYWVRVKGVRLCQKLTLLERWQEGGRRL